VLFWRCGPQNLQILHCRNAQYYDRTTLSAWRTTGTGNFTGNAAWTRVVAHGRIEVSCLFEGQQFTLFPILSSKSPILPVIGGFMTIFQFFVAPDTPEQGMQ
jgi:hypothetical protein